jgi:cellulose synthase/poly-beta-1,6-N-acetylglucosamine synthase-like glycosyltransferase
MKYENFIRRHETKLGSVVGVDGGIDAVRKELYQPMNNDQLPDFVLPLKVVEHGYRVVYEPEAILKEPSLTTGQDEYSMRVRVTLRTFWAITDMRHLLSLKKFKLFAWQLWSHKVLRYLCFIFLIGAYLSNLALWSDNTFYKFFFVFQNLLYLASLLSPILQTGKPLSRLLHMLTYFFLINLAAMHAFIKFLLGKKQVFWTPRRG